MSFLHKTLSMNIECSYVHVEIFVQFLFKFLTIHCRLRDNSMITVAKYKYDESHQAQSGEKSEDRRHAQYIR
jgi:hypothetical protein